MSNPCRNPSRPRHRSRRSKRNRRRANARPRCPTSTPTPKPPPRPPRRNRCKSLQRIRGHNSPPSKPRPTARHNCRVPTTRRRIFLRPKSPNQRPWPRERIHAATHGQCGEHGQKRGDPQPEPARGLARYDRQQHASPAPAPTKAPSRPDSTAIARAEGPAAPARQTNNTPSPIATPAENVQAPGVSAAPSQTALAANSPRQSEQVPQRRSMLQTRQHRRLIALRQTMLPMR